MEKMLITVESDAWADGQIGSKLWLCEALEQCAPRPDPAISLLGGWYAMTAFLLFARGRIQPRMVRSFDVDPACEDAARRVNDRWAYAGKFSAHTADVNDPAFDVCDPHWGEPPDIVVNTACEHMDAVWFAHVPQGTMLALQGCDMEHEQHSHRITSVADLATLYPLRRPLWEGVLDFSYPGAFSFRRSMLIGIK
jgi:hypothetical protein